MASSARAWCALATVFFAALAGPVVQAAPYLQLGYDAARTGASPDVGPAVDDIVFRIETGAWLGPDAQPLIIGRAIFVAAVPSDLATAGSILRIDLATAHVSTVAVLPPGATGFASDGTFAFVGRDGGIEAHALDGAGLAWSWDHPDFAGVQGGRTRCRAPAVGGGYLYVTCAHEPRLEATGQAPFTTGGGVFVSKIAIATGDANWTWSYTLGGRAGPPSPANGVGPTPPGTWWQAPSVVGGVVMVTLEDSADAQGTVVDRFVALDERTGDFLWEKRFDDTPPLEMDALLTSPLSGAGQPQVPTGNADAVFLRLRDLVAADPATGQELWRAPLEGDAGFNSNGGFALTGESLFVGTGSRLRGFNVATQDEIWGAPTPTGSPWRSDSLVVANATVFGATNTQRVLAFDAGTGDLRWNHRVRNTSGAEAVLAGWAVGEGVLAYVTSAGSLTVLGRTPASLQPAATASTAYPMLGEALAVDLSSSGPGIQGPPSAFRVEWGDGSADDWQAAPAFTHTYTAAGDRHARLFVRNDAGQTSSMRLVFHVGADEPVAPTFLESAFSRDHQDLTFGVLGIALALGGGALAVARGRRRRWRLQREAEAIEKAYSTTRARPMECEAVLAERRAHVRGLGLDGKLAQAEVLTLERRVDELAASLRLEAIDEQFGFLSVSMARTLREMLADGRIQRWEREHFLEALERDRHLTEDQKRRVQGRIEEWFAQDARGDRALGEEAK